MFEDKSFRQKFIISVGITAAGVVILATVLAIMGVKISDTAAKISTSREEMASQKQKIDELAALQKDSEKAARYVSMVENSLPTKDSLIDLPKEIAIMAQKSGAQEGFSFGSETSEISSVTQAINFQVVTNGSLDQIIAFLKEMEGSRFIISVKAIDLLWQGQGFRGTINGQIYFRT